MRVIRGAINIENNKTILIKKATEQLINKIVNNEELEEKQFFSIIVSVTKDITKLNPCTVIRKMGYTDTALMGVQEMDIENSLPLTIRILIHAEGSNSTKFYYLRDTKKLRSQFG